MRTRDRQSDLQTRPDAWQLEQPPRPKEYACLVQLYGPDLGKRSEIGGEPFTIGRSPKCELSIDQSSISRTHARIIWETEGHVVSDLGSTNGTFVNDDRVETKSLKDGDQLRVGRVIFKYMTGDQIEQSYHEAIYRMMTVDALTDAHNRRYFDEAMTREFIRAKRYKRLLSLIIVDIDHFKTVNDKHGHLVGDELLRKVATVVRGRLRQGDIFARIGGDEFALILPEANLESARSVAQRVLDAVRALSIQGDDGGPLRCSASIGCAEWNDDMATTSALYDAADKSLYAAKQRGRGCVGP
ncbi:MAG: GGDEF domain-containing protein [Polyangiaceae bacterium]